MNLEGLYLSYLKTIKSLGLSEPKMILCASITSQKLYLMQKGELPNNLLVTTVMANLGFEKAWEKLGGTLIRTPVGDRHVQAKMLESGAKLGGEQSGHIILGKFATTGDGLLVALEVLFAIRKGKKASSFFNKFKKTPQILKNISVKDKSIIKNLDVKKSIKKAEELMNGYGRILVRASGTESKIRVMGESENKALLEKSINIILTKIK